jgi:5-(carboxyamino)imidazole ribonucleotide synthase
MLALAAARLGVKTRLYDPQADACGGQVAELVTGDFDDLKSLEKFCAGLDAATVEFENVPVGAMRAVERHGVMRPDPGAVELAQDRVAERRALAECGFATPKWCAVDSLEDLRAGCAALGLPCVLKARRLGYDGKGQFWIHAPADIERAWASMGGQPTMLDEAVSFEREVSLLSVRGCDGEVAHYAPTENVHRGGILVSSTAPAGSLDAQVVLDMHERARSLMAKLEYVGVLAVEFFDVDGRMVANEMAPRVHNSGHWTMNSGATCQFENHVRAVLGLPLGPVAPAGAACMVNLIGSVPELRALLAMPGWHAHLYGKEPRPGRKLGHMNWCGPADELIAARDAMIRLIEDASSIEIHHA